jgi:hypothetical protein
MGMNLRGHMDLRRYNPSRDLAYSFQKIAQIAMDGLAEDQWHPLFAAYLRQNGVTEEHLGLVAQSLAKYMALCVQRKDLTNPRDLLQEAGFFDLPEPAQAAVMIQIGRVVTGMFMSCIRDVDVGSEEEEPPLHDKELAARATRARELIAARARWYAVYRRVRDFVRGLRRAFTKS